MPAFVMSHDRLPFLLGCVLPLPLPSRSSYPAAVSVMPEHDSSPAHALSAPARLLNVGQLWSSVHALGMKLLLMGSPKVQEPAAEACSAPGLAHL